MKHWQRMIKQWKKWKLPGDRPRTYSVYVDDTDTVWLTTDVHFAAGFRYTPFSSAPALKKVLAGTRNHCGGVRRCETVLMLSSCM